MPNKLDCYRISGEVPEVLVSSDGGQSWSIGWGIPVGRELFAYRTARGGLTPRDVEIITTDQTYNIIVAMGTKGVLLGDSDGEWQRVAVLNTSPSSLISENLYSAIQVIQFEISILIFVGLLTLLVSTLFFTGWVMRVDKNSLEETKEKTIIRDPLSVFSGLPLLFYSIVGFLFVAVQWEADELNVFFIIHTLAMLLFSFGALWTWKRLIGATSFPIESQELRKLSIAIAIMAPAIATIPFILWAFGLVYNYNHAVVVSIILFIGALYAGFRRTTRITDELPKGLQEGS